MIVSRNLDTWVPCSLNAKIACIKFLTSFVWKGFLEPQNNVDWSKSIWQERFWVGTQQLRAKRVDVRFHAPNGLFCSESITVDISIGDLVTIAVVPAEVGAIWFDFRK